MASAGGFIWEVFKQSNHVVVTRSVCCHKGSVANSDGSVKYVIPIENVPYAPLRADIVCTGSMFGLPVVRRRKLEIGGFRAPLRLNPTHGNASTQTGELAVVAGHGGGGNVKARSNPLHQAAIRKRNSAQGWLDAMGIQHYMTRDQVAEAIPPAYAEFVGREVLQQSD